MTLTPPPTDAGPRTGMVDAPCPLCGEHEARVRFEEPPYRILRCAGCALTYVRPRLGPQALLDEVYDAHYWRSTRPRERGYADYRADAELYLRTYRRRLRRIRAHLPAPGRALDVGCAAGYFLEVLRGEGWDVLGLEPSDSIRATAQERLGTDAVIGGTLAEADLERASFDLISLWDVLEHLPDPANALARCRELLRPEGVLVLETQNVASAFARLLGPRWQHFKHREHLAHFDPTTLARALGSAGFEVLRMGPRGGGKYVTTDFIAERSARIHAALPRLVRGALRFAPRSAYVNLFDELVVCARPR